jgi:hypothetical protein
MDDAESGVEADSQGREAAFGFGQGVAMLSRALTGWAALRGLR